MKSIIHRILKIISTAVFIVLVLIIAILLLYIIRVNFMASNDKLGDVKVNFYTILTQSMYPTIKAGDVVVTYKEDADHYNSGDVVTFISRGNGGITVTHRITDVYLNNGNYSYKTKGDNNNTDDRELVDNSDVLGKVVFKVPKAGYFQQFMVSKTGWIVAVLLPCLGIVIYDILKIIKTATRKSKDIITNNSKTDDARKKLKEVIKDEEK